MMVTDHPRHQPIDICNIELMRCPPLRLEFLGGGRRGTGMGHRQSHFTDGTRKRKQFHFSGRISVRSWYWSVRPIQQQQVLLRGSTNVEMRKGWGSSHRPWWCWSTGSAWRSRGWVSPWGWPARSETAPRWTSTVGSARSCGCCRICTCPPLWRRWWK